MNIAREFIEASLVRVVVIALIAALALATVPALVTGLQSRLTEAVKLQPPRH